MELTKLSNTELLAKCEELGINKCKSKNKGELIDLINSKIQTKKKVELIIKEDDHDHYEEKLPFTKKETENYTLYIWWSNLPVYKKDHLIDFFHQINPF